MNYEPIFELDPKTFETVTVSNAVKTIAAATLLSGSLQAMAVMITVEGTTGKNARFRQDGGDPAADAGHLLLPGDILIVSGANAIANLKFIRVSDADVTLQVTGYF